MSEGWFLWGALIGFWWGGWFADRRAEARRDPAMTVLYNMVSRVLYQRKFVGRGATITRFERFEFQGEKFMLSVQAEGDPAAIEADAA